MAADFHIAGEPGGGKEAIQCFPLFGRIDVFFGKNRCVHPGSNKIAPKIAFSNPLKKIRIALGPLPSPQQMLMDIKDASASNRFADLIE